MLHKEVIEEIPENELLLHVSHFLPHLLTIKETSSLSSTKIRSVFNASAKITNFPSLDENGINFIEINSLILARFCLYKIGVISHIRVFFLSISLQENGRKMAL